MCMQQKQQLEAVTHTHTGDYFSRRALQQRAAIRSQSRNAIVVIIVYYYFIIVHYIRARTRKKDALARMRK